ncbi:MAG: hypothetical protein ACLR7K_15335 [Subdoligranulum sp.]
MNNIGVIPDFGRRLSTVRSRGPADFDGLPEPASASRTGIPIICGRNY